MCRTSGGSKSRELGKGFYTMRVRYGFMDEPNVMRALAQCRVAAFPHQPDGDLVLHRPRETAAASRAAAAFWRWRDRLFILLTNLALDATEFFRIPPNRVVELGGQIEI